MKQIGRTNYHGVLVEFTEKEFEELVIAAGAMEGKTRNRWSIEGNENFYRAVDMTPFFQSIQKFVNIKFIANEITEVGDRLQKLFQGNDAAGIPNIDIDEKAH
jgi:hypothetical protein